MRRIAMLLGMMMMIIVVVAGVAVAVSKTCGDNLPCRGTDNDDVIHERRGNGERDRILALDGKDDVEAVLFSNDRDVVDGGQKRDHLDVTDGDNRDSVRGGRGRDLCVKDQGDAERSCEQVRTGTAGVLSAGFGDTASN